MTLRDDFPIFRTFDGAFLDSAASSQKAGVVIDALNRFYSKQYANIHRGMYALSENATHLYEDARSKVAAFINAPVDSIVFTKGATEALNLLASCFSFSADDEIILTEAEHHANYLPWRFSGANIKVAKVTDAGELDMDHFQSLFTSKTRLVAVPHASNVLGTIFPLKDIVQITHAHDALLCVDGAQGIVHDAVDVRDLDCDFYVFSGHKLYGPNGIGVLYGKKKFLMDFPPYQYGGDMVQAITKDFVTFSDVPAKFEAGTPPIAEAIGLGAALDYIVQNRSLGEKIEAGLFLQFNDFLISENVKILGTAKQKTPVISFIPPFAHPQDIGMILSKENVCVRVGHHCAIPVHKRFDCTSSVRLSLGYYNSASDFEKFKNAFLKAKRMFT